MENFTATVISVNNDIAVLSLDRRDASCDGCRLTAVCSRADANACGFEARIASPCIVRPGMRVEVALPASSASRSVIFGLGLPLVVMLLAALGASWAGLDDLWIATVSIILPIGCYAGIYLLLRRIFASSDIVCYPVDCPEQ